jgi:hypothetical protein
LWWYEHPDIPIGQFQSGTSIVSGVLLALCTLSFNRVKDLAGDTIWQGVDPMRVAYRFARNTLSAAYVSVFVTGLLIAQLFVTTGRPARVLLAVTIGLVTHLRVCLWFLLGGIRHQVEAVAGQRSAERPSASAERVFSLVPPVDVGDLLERESAATVWPTMARQRKTPGVPDFCGPVKKFLTTAGSQVGGA